MERLRSQASYAYTIDQFIKSIDIFGQPIGLYYNGKPTYQTKTGGVCTVTIGCILLGYIMSSMLAVVKREYEISLKTLKLLEYEDSSSYILNSSYIDFLYYLDYDYDRNPEVFEKPWRYYQVDLIEITKNSTHRIEQFSSEEWCLDQDGKNELYFPGSVDIEEFTCFQFGNLTFQGTFGSDELSYYRIQFHECRQEYLDRWGYDDTCANESLIEDVIEQSVLKFIFFEQFFEENELKDFPIRQIPQIHYFNFKSDFSASYQVEVNKNYVNLQDSWLYASYREQQLTYYNLEFGNLIIGSQLENHPMLEILLKKGFDEKIIQRQARNMVDSLSDVGGLLSVLRYGIAFLIGNYVRRSYYSSMVSKMFKHQSSSQLDAEGKCRKLEPPQGLKGLKEHFYSSLANSVLNRKPAEMARKKRLLSCRSKLTDNQKYIQEQINIKINEQFSIINVLKQLRELKIISYLLLTKEQRYLLPYTLGNIIRSNPQAQQRYEERLKIDLEPTTTCRGEATPAILKKQQTLIQLQKSSEEDSGQQMLLTPRQNEKQIKKFLQQIIEGVKDDKANQELLMQLINVEERDFMEQLIMLQNLEDESDSDSFDMQLPFKLKVSPVKGNQHALNTIEQPGFEATLSCEAPSSKEYVEEEEEEEIKSQKFCSEEDLKDQDGFSHRPLKKTLERLLKMKK